MAAKQMRLIRWMPYSYHNFGNVHQKNETFFRFQSFIRKRSLGPAIFFTFSETLHGTSRHSMQKAATPGDGRQSA